MTGDGFSPQQAREALHEAARLRFPATRQDGERIHPQKRIEALEDHYAACAIARGELEEAQLYIRGGLKSLEDEWDAVEGWETVLGAGDKTQKAIVAAKRSLRPDLYSGIREGKWLADKLRTQIRRLERDEEAASRLYSMVSGG